MLFDKRTRAYLRNAEFGFLGVSVPTRVHTPRFCGEFTFVNFFLKLLYPLFNAGESDFFGLLTRPFRINWLIVGIYFPPSLVLNKCKLPFCKLELSPHIQAVHFKV